MTTEDQLFKLCLCILALLANRFAAHRASRRSQHVHSNPGHYPMTIQRFMWVAMTLSAMLLAAYAGSLLLLPALREPFLQQIFVNTPIVIAAHIGGSVVAILVGAAQSSRGLRSRFVTAHRLFGRVYVVAVLIGGAAGLVLATNASEGPIAQLGFGSLAVCWIGSTLNAYRYIRVGNKLAHGAWMIRSYSLTMAGVTLRLSLPLLEAAGVEYETAYRVVSWLCWLPNLLVAEWIVRTGRRKLPAAPERIGTISRSVVDIL
jgi:uncharacterized membrane protein